MTVIPNPPSLGDSFTNESTGVSYSYDGEKWVITSTPGSEQSDQFGEDLSALTTRVSTGEGVQEQIKTTVSNALDTQSEIQEDVSTLEAKVQALEGTVTDGVWRFTSRQSPLQGEFDLLDGSGNKINGNWSLARFVYLTNPDYNNVNQTFDFLGLEDYIRIGGAGGSAVYRVKSGKTGTDALVEYQIEHISSTGVVLESFAHDFEFTPGFDPTAYATIDYVDEQDEKAVKKAGTSTVSDNFRIKTESKSFISLNNGNEMRLYHVADPTGQDDAWAANKGYVDTAVEPLSTRDYVDQAVADAVAPDLSGYLRKSEFYHYNRAPAVLSWKYNSTSSGDSAPPDQSFKITKNGDDTYIRFSFKTYNNADLGDAAYSDTNVSIDNGPVGTIWYWHYQEENWRLKEQFRINSFRWNYNNHFEMRMTSRHGNKSYTSGTAYYITVGGFF